MRKNYYFGSERVAVRENDALAWLLTDQQGSTVATANENGTLQSEMRYSAFGETRTTSGTTPTDYLYTGQREEAEVGLYYYGARFYDPALGRFIQADTLIPEPSSPQSWDRYAYVNNNPVKFTDPSGHRECESGESGNCGFIAPRTIAVVKKLLKGYGVTMTGNWTVSEGYSVYVGSYLTGEALRPYDNTGGTAAFKKAFGSMEYECATDLGGWYGKASDGKISILAGKVTSRLLVHELGHSFEKHIYSRDGEKYTGTNNPIQMLIDGGVYDIYGKLITGLGNRQNDKLAPDNGYRSNYIPDQYHPISMEDGDNSFEDWADMFMNWVYDSFYPNAAGAALDNWITTNMSEWIQ